MTAPEMDIAVLAYYGREARDIVETEALAGLSVAAFRGARTRLVKRGMLVRNARGRYAPVSVLA